MTPRPHLRPTSLLQLTWLALALLLVPPAVSIGTAFRAVDALARSGEAAAVEAAEAVGLARDLVEATTAMQRHARQRAILRDDQFLELYEHGRSQFLAAVDDLRAVELPDDLRGRLDALVADEAAVHDVLVAHPAGAPEAEPALRGLTTLSADAGRFLSASGDVIAATARRLHADAADLEHRLLVRAAWVLPVVLVTLSFVLRAIVRPLRRLDHAIDRIGAGDLERPVDVGGSADLRRLGERVEWLRERLLALESDRIRLFRHVSHELKTPLASLREGSQLLADEVVGRLAPEQHEIVDILRENAALLQQRIEDLLRLGELRTQAAALVVRPVALADLVGEVLARHRISARARSLSWDVRLEPVALLGDGPRLATVVDNLVGNAVKFSPRGGAVRVALARRGGDAVLDVADDGPGIVADEAERVFEAFYQGDASRRGHVDGTGIGLTLARELARAHGGDVVVLPSTSGARLRLTLPVRQEAA